jgi:peroxiredoxin
MSAKFIGILMFFCISLMSCHQNPVTYFQREGRTLSLLESEFEPQLDLLNRSFKARDSASFVKAVFKDTIWSTNDTITVRFDYIAVLTDGEELPLTAPREGIFDYIGKRLPDFILPDMDGNPVQLSEFYDRPVVLNFWFRACTPCKKEMPRLNQIKKIYEDQVNFVAICLDDPDHLKGFFKYHDFDYKHLVSGREIAQKLGIVAYPKNIVIKKDGEVSQVLDALLETIDADGNILTGEGRELIREIEKVWSYRSYLINL